MKMMKWKENGEENINNVAKISIIMKMKACGVMKERRNEENENVEENIKEMKEEKWKRRKKIERKKRKKRRNERKSKLLLC